MKTLRTDRHFITSRTVAVIVAHPDDETLWAGGTILMHPRWQCSVLSLCRASDAERAPRFYRAIERLGASGAMADLEDGPDQMPAAESDLRETIQKFTDGNHFDLVLSHGPRGEYTRHRRHEEVSKTVLALWREGRLDAGTMAFFAYSDDGRSHLPLPEKNAHFRNPLPAAIVDAKREIITTIYGFAPESWEARTTPTEEAFWIFESPAAASVWVNKKMRDHESPCSV